MRNRRAAIDYDIETRGDREIAEPVIYHPVRYRKEETAATNGSTEACSSRVGSPCIIIDTTARSCAVDAVGNLGDRTEHITSHADAKRI